MNDVADAAKITFPRHKRRRDCSVAAHGNSRLQIGGPSPWALPAFGYRERVPGRDPRRHGYTEISYGIDHLAGAPRLLQTALTAPVRVRTAQREKRTCCTLEWAAQTIVLKSHRVSLVSAGCRCEQPLALAHRQKVGPAGRTDSRTEQSGVPPTWVAYLTVSLRDESLVVSDTRKRRQHERGVATDGFAAN
jgi:hypothetical protein